MSTKGGKVRFSFRKHRNALILGPLLALQFALTVVLSVSLAAHIIWPEAAKGATAAPVQISYEGRLTDSSGNALGGTGTAYCYRFSIYDAPTGGNKLWPGNTPSATLATTTDGVFSAIIGSADTLSSSIFDFSTTSSAYLQVDVSTTSPTCASNVESLTPRQAVLSSAYAMTANNLGSQLRVDKDNGRAQTGTGAGAATPTYFGLDWKNTSDYVGQTCSTNGLMWYNSAQSQALVCEGGLIQRIGNSTTTIAGINVNNSTMTGAASNGVVAFSNSNGVSFGINGNTITASVAAAASTLSFYENFPINSVSTAITYPTQSNSAVVPFYSPYGIAGSYLRLPVSMSAQSTTFGTTGNTTFSASQLLTFRAVVYSQGTGANSLSMQSVASGSAPLSYQISLQANSNSSQYTVTQNISFPQRGFTTNTFSTSFALTNASFQLSTGSISNFNGIRYIDIPFATTLSAGQYWLAMGMSSTTSTQGTAALISNRLLISFMGQPGAGGAVTYGNLGSTTNVSNLPAWGMGQYSNAGGATTASIALSQVSAAASNPRLFFNIQGY